VADLPEHPAGFIPNKRPISPRHACKEVDAFDKSSLKDFGWDNSETMIADPEKAHTISYTPN
jgi:hypothetical protein